MVDSTLAFNILARDRGASSVFDKVARSADKTSASLAKTGKISDDVAKASANLTKAHNSETTALDRVQVAEAKLAEVRNNSNAKTSQTLAAEKALAKARRDAAVAGNVAQKAAKDLGQTLDNEGKKAGKGFGASVLHWFTGAGKDLEKAGQVGGEAVSSGIMGVLKTPVLGPALLAVAGATVATVLPAVGAIAGAGLVAGFGAGIAGLGIMFAAKSDAVSKVWSKTMTGLGSDMQLLSKPFEGTLIHLAGSFQQTVDKFNPVLGKAFAAMAGPIQKFADDGLKALEKFIPAIGPITTAFDGVIGALGPALQSLVGDLSAGMTDLANSVAKNPAALADMATGIGGVTKETLGFITTLNDINTNFSTLTGGVSMVTVLFKGLEAVIGVLAFPFVALSKVIGGVNALLGKTGGDSADAGKSMLDAAGNTAALAQGLTGAGDAARHMTPAQQAAAQAVADAAKKAADAKKEFNGYITAMFQLQNLSLGLSGAQINLQAAIDAASASVKTNGKTLDINTEKGRANKTALDQIASSANTQTEAMLRSKKGVRAAADGAEAARAQYITFAMQMGKTRAQAEAMATAALAIPKKTQTDFKADIRDLDSKIRTAKARLADPKLSATKKAQLRAEIAQLLAAKAQAQRAIDSLSGKTVSIQINTYKNLIQTTIPGGTGVRLPGRAVGGPVKKGEPYMVGEHGPEPFVPDQNGTIIPNGATARGSAVGGQAVRIEIAAGDSGGYTRFLVGELQKYIRASGGNVQVVLGR